MLQYVRLDPLVGLGTESRFTNQACALFPDLCRLGSGGNRVRPFTTFTWDTQHASAVDPRVQLLTDLPHTAQEALTSDVTCLS